MTRPPAPVPAAPPPQAGAAAPAADMPEQAMLLFAQALAGQPVDWPALPAGARGGVGTTACGGGPGTTPAGVGAPPGLPPAPQAGSQAGSPARADRGRGLPWQQPHQRLALLRALIALQPGGLGVLAPADLADPALWGDGRPRLASEPQAASPRPVAAPAARATGVPTSRGAGAEAPCVAPYVAPRVAPRAAPCLAPCVARCIASWPRPVLLAHVLRAMEGARIDAELARQFPGALADLAAWRRAGRPSGMWAQRLGALAEAHAALRAPGACSIDSLRAAIAACRDLPGRARPVAAPGALWRLNAPDEPTRPGPGDAPGGADAARWAGPATAVDRPDHARWPAAAPDTTTPPPPDGLAAPPPRADADSAATPAATPAAPPPAQPPQRGPARNPPSAPAAGQRQLWFDEWDQRLQRYLRRWTCVHEQPAPAGDPAYLAQLQARHGPLLRQLRRQFAAAPPRARARGGAATEGDQIDLDLALTSLVDRRAGALAEARPYRHRPRAQRDTCTAVLLDMSGSTGFAVPPAPGSDADGGSSSRSDHSDDDDDDLLYGFRPRRGPPAPPPRRVIDIAHDAIALMCEGMQQLGDRHAVYGFSGQGRLRVDLRVAKRFDQPWSARGAAALAALQPQGSTRTGAAVRYAVQQLLAQPERHRVLIVVTDGYPQDEDYGPDPADRSHGLHDTAMALREAERGGIAAFCVSVDRAAHDHLRTICPPRRYLVIDDVHQLPARLSALYRRLGTP